MANLRVIRKRIASVKNTRQITRAMKLVAGAKLRRATDAAIAARPYNVKLKEMLDSLLARTEDMSHPLFQQREQVRRIKVVAFSSDRGLCGSYNSNIIKRVDSLIREHSDCEMAFVAVGKKVRGHIRRKEYELSSELLNVNPKAFPEFSQELARGLVEDFQSHRADEVYLVYHRFKTALTQTVMTERLLPLATPDVSESPGGTPASLVDFIYEPSRPAILDALLPQLVANRVMQAFLEATASEHGARMTAMDNATRNASEMIDSLTLEYNKARQAAITKELSEIVGGAEAL